MRWRSHYVLCESFLGEWGEGETVINFPYCLPKTRAVSERDGKCKFTLLHRNRSTGNRKENLTPDQGTKLKNS